MVSSSEKYQTLRKLIAPKSTGLATIGAVTAGWVDGASWLSNDLLLIVGWFQADTTREPEVFLMREEDLFPLRVECLSYTLPDSSAHGLKRIDGCVLAVHLPDYLADQDGNLGRLMIRTEETTLAIGPDELAQTVTSLDMLLRSRVAALDSATRAKIMAFVLSATQSVYGTHSKVQLSRSLFAIRETLRDRLPASLIAKDQPQGLMIDKLMQVDSTTFYMRGWMRDHEAQIASLTAVSPEGCRVDLFDNLFRYKRPDVEQFYGTSPAEQFSAKAGFINCFELAFPSQLDSGWLVEMCNTVGNAIESAAPPVVRDPIPVRNTILGDIAVERRTQDELLANHIFPAISRLQELHQKTIAIESVEEYGRPVNSADVSILIPLYGRIDFLEQQLAQFAHDPQIQQADLIYILDSPELADQLMDSAAGLSQLYRVPFQIVTLQQNAGFAGANNMGASVAHGRLLLLLNSDVLPDKPGWLGKMVKFYDATPQIGALGPKLLYEDESLQHAGMYFSRLTGTNLWENRHYFKGLHRSLPSANITRPVPAVTGACMMVSRELYHEVGGIQGAYVQGDYEDSDFCLRLFQQGFKNWYLPDAELYHLEGQSYPSLTRQQNSRFNMWLHTRLWGDSIETVMREEKVWR